MTRSTHAKQQGISYQSAWRIWQWGELPAHQLPTGTTSVDVLPTSPAIRHLPIALYARVLSGKDRNNLEGHAELVAALCAARGWQVATVVTECGTAVNDQRLQVPALPGDSIISLIQVERTDRHSCFGVHDIQRLMKAQGRKLVIVNEAAVSQKDLMQDFVAIITSLSGRLYGRRRASWKKAQLLTVLEAS